MISHFREKIANSSARYPIAKGTECPGGSCLSSLASLCTTSPLAFCTPTMGPDGGSPNKPTPFCHRAFACAVPSSWTALFLQPSDSTQSSLPWASLPWPWAPGSTQHHTFPKHQYLSFGPPVICTLITVGILLK